MEPPTQADRARWRKPQRDNEARDQRSRATSLRPPTPTHRPRFRADRGTALAGPLRCGRPDPRGGKAPVGRQRLRH